MKTFWKWMSFVALSSSAHAITLDQALKEAFQKNEIVEQQKNKVEQQDSRISQARGAVMPNLSLQGTYFVQPQLSDPIARTFFPNEQRTVNLNLTQPLFKGLREFAYLRQQNHLLEASKNNLENRLLNLYYEVAQNFLQVLTLEEDLKNLNLQHEIYLTRVTELQGRVKRGESSASEALSAQSLEISTAAEIDQTKANLAIARENFAFLTGLPANSTLNDPEMIASGSEKTRLRKLKDYLAGISQRADVKAATEQYEASDDEVSFAKGGHWPSLDATGNYYFERPPGVLNDVKWDVQLKLTIPLFEGGATQARVREAAFKRKDAELEMVRVKRRAEQEIRSLYQSLSNRLTQLVTLKRSLEIAEKNVGTLQKEFRRGLSRNIDVHVALAEFRNARRTLDQLHFSAQLEMIQLQIASAEPISAVKGALK